jgi:hypothetical protein
MPRLAAASHDADMTISQHWLGQDPHRQTRPPIGVLEGVAVPTLVVDTSPRRAVIETDRGSERLTSLKGGQDANPFGP